MTDIYTRILLSVQSGSTLKTIQSVSSALGKNGLAGDLEKVAQTAKTTGLDVGKLETYQAKAGEAAARLGVAEAKAAEALARANNLATSGTASMEKLATANAHAALAAEKVKVAKDAAGNAMQKVASEAKHLSGAMEDASSKSGKTGKALEQMGGLAKTAAVAGVTVLTSSLVGMGVGLTDTVNKTRDFQESMLNTYGANDLTRAQIDAIGNSLLELGPKVRKGPQDLAEAFYFVKGAGFDASKSMDILERSAKAAASGLTETEVPANAATAVLKAFPALETAQAFDIMTAGVNYGKTEWKDFGPAIGAVSLHAQRAGVSFQETTAALSTLTNTMPSTAEAATSLKSLLQTSSQFEQLTDRATSLGYSFDTNAYKSMNFIDRLRYLYKVTGNNEEAVAKLLGQEEALPAITALLADNAGDYSKALQGVTNSAGAAESQFKKTGEGSKASWAVTQARIEALQIKIGSGLLPVIDSLVTAFNNVLTVSIKVAKFFRDNEVAMVALQSVLIAVGVVILSIIIPAFIAWAIATWAVVAPMLVLAAPFILAGVIIAAVLFLIIMAIRHWGAIVAWLQNIWGAFTGWFMGVLGATGAFFVGLWSGLSSWFIGALGSIGAFFTNIWNGIVAGLKVAWSFIISLIVGYLTLLINIWTFPFRAIAALFTWLYNHNYYFKALIDAIVGFVRAGVAWLQQAWTNSINWIVGAWQALVGFAVALWGQISGAIQVGFSAAIAFVAAIWASISAFFVNAWNTYIVIPLTALWTNVSTFFANAWINWIVGPLTALWANVSGFFSSVWVNYVAGPIGGLWNSLSSTISGWATSAWQWGVNLIQGFINGIKSKAGEIGGMLGGIWNDAMSKLGFHDLPGMPGHAEGIIDSPVGHLAMVGERGPELMYVPQHASILPNKDIDKFASQVSLTSLPGDVDRMMTLTLPPVETRAEGRSAAPQQTSSGNTIIYAPTYNINTMARSQSEVRRLVDMINDEQAKDFRLETSGYASGGIH